MKYLPTLLVTTAIALTTLTQSRAALILQLQAGNYDPTTGVWTDTSGSGNNATNSGATKPTLVTGATPNGSSAVSFATGNYLNLTLGINSGNTSGYTAFVFLQPSTTQPNGFTNGSGGTIFAGPNDGTFQYRLSNGKQDIVRSAQADLGASPTVLSTTSFSSIDATTSPTGGTYRLNGADVGTSSGSSYSSSITLIGSNKTGDGDEYFNGQIAEIRIYDTVLTATERQAVESQFTASYITPVPEPGTWVMLVGGAGVMLMTSRRRFSSSV